MSQGATYDVGVTALVFGIVDTITVLVFFRQSGDGPLLPCVTGLRSIHSVSQVQPAAA